MNGFVGDFSVHLLQSDARNHCHCVFFVLICFVWDVFLNLGMVVQLTRWHPTTLSLRSWIWICKTLLVHPFDTKHLELRRSDDMTMGCHWWDGVALLGADLGE